MGNGSMRTTTKRALGVALVAAAMLLLSGCLETDVRYLASDALNGRNQNTAGSLSAQDRILTYLEQWTTGPNTGTGRARYKQATPGSGTNLIGVLPGTDLADEYVVVGAHYDGLGNGCASIEPGDTICNGATDNATGAAIVIDILRGYAVSGTQPRRSIVFAFWDREEDGLVGSKEYTDHPLIPLEDTVAYVNFDIQGANLRPSGASSTFAIGAETGGPVLVDAVTDAAAPGALDTWLVSLVFGQGRSDHSNFLNHGVPSVFFSDSTGPCYHTTGDDPDIVDYTKLAEQDGTARRLVADLANRNDTPTITTGTPLATYGDAVIVNTLFDRLMADLSSFPPAQQTQFLTSRATVAAAVSAGPAAFDNTTMINVLLATATVVNDILTTGPCESFIPEP